VAGVDQQGPSWDEAKTQWERINARVSRDIPSLRTIPWEAILQSGGVPQFGESRSAQLLRYLLALDDVCQQALYAMEQLPLFTCRGEYSSPWELYAKYYIYDVLSRVKTATDLLALLLNVVFGLGLPTKECSLERG